MHVSKSSNDVLLKFCWYQAELNTEFFVARIKNALLHRQRAFKGKAFYRVVHSDGDSVPGLVVDRYDQDVVVQIYTAGLEPFQSAILQAVEEVLTPRRIVLRNDHVLIQSNAIYRQNLTFRIETVVVCNVLTFLFLQGGAACGGFTVLRGHRQGAQRLGRRDQRYRAR